MREDDEKQPPEQAGEDRSVEARVVPAEQILGEDREVWIEYHGVRYLLRVTRRGRLILTK